MNGKKVAAFGEIMVRLNPRGYLRLSQAEELEISYAGAEASVCVSLCNQGMEAKFITKLPENQVADAAVRALRSYRVDVDEIVRGGERIGVYYLEKGASQRASKVIYDRKYSAISQAKAEDFDWDALLGDVDWFHFTGITPALGGELPEICEAACRAAKKHGAVVSCDLNYRGNLWPRERAREVMSRLVSYCDVVIGNEEDAETCLGIAPKNVDVVNGQVNGEDYAEIAERICTEFGCSKVAFTLRRSISASDNNWAGILYADGRAWYSKHYDIRIVDRVGGGDAFAGGLIHALRSGRDAQSCIEYAVAASCLKQTMEQDFNLATVAEIEKLMKGDGSGRVQR